MIGCRLGWLALLGCFGGRGEPLFHPRTVEWVARANALGAQTEIITIGTLLTERRSRQLIAAGLDVRWVSIDGATPESYADVRLGAELPKVIANVACFRRQRRGSHYPTPKVGLAFVAMRRNAQDLSAVLHLGRRLGATLFSVSNILPYSQEMQAERVYAKTIRNTAYLSAPHLPKLSLPKMDIDEWTQPAFAAALNSGCNVTFAGNSLSGAKDVCNFVESGTLSVAWDGGVSPCWQLMHTQGSPSHSTGWPSPSAGGSSQG
jgi:MoaA/NifB/PqqE/SkfB family radical SAM enzyme